MEWRLAFTLPLLPSRIDFTTHDPSMWQYYQQRGYCRTVGFLGSLYSLIVLTGSRHLVKHSSFLSCPRSKVGIHDFLCFLFASQIRSRSKVYTNLCQYSIIAVSPLILSTANSFLIFLIILTCREHSLYKGYLFFIFYFFRKLKPDMCGAIVPSVHY